MKSRLFLLFVVSCLLTTILNAQNILINEFMPDNEETINDSFGESSDWIEIYNNSDEDVSLYNYMLSDDVDNLGKWSFPDTVIESNSFILLFASDNDETITSNELHVNFKISSSGEDIYLSNDNGVIIDHISPVDLGEDISYGRFPDGSNSFTKFYSPTPEETNNLENTLLFSHQGGFFTEPFNLEILSSDSSIIYCTTDGSVPTENSLVYSYPLLIDYKYSSQNIISEIPTTPDQSLIAYKAWESPLNEIDKANILRCVSYKNGVKKSIIYTQTFIVDSTVFDKYNTPVISLVTDGNNLFSQDSGIYVPGVHFNVNNPQWSGNYFQHGDEWEREVHIEFYEPDGSLGFTQDAGMRIHGGLTRHACQKTLRLYARDQYGEDSFNYQLLPQKQNDEYKRFLLRTTVGSWAGQAIINDALAHEIVSELDVEYQDYQPVVVFINGEYWGIHTIRDRIDERYIAYTHDLDKDSVEFKDANNVHYNNLLNFIGMNDLAYEDNYEYVETQIDISNYIDYHVSEMFFKNYDWPANNMKLWRPQTSTGKWRWILYDMDAGFGNFNYNMFIHSTRNDSSITWPNSPSSTFLFRNLLKNDKFVNLFIDRYAEILNQNFDANIMIDKLNTIKAQYEDEVPQHISRWNFPNSFSEWEDDIQSQILTFIENRPCIVEDNIKEFFNLNEFDFSCNTANDSFNSKKIDLKIFPNPNNGQFHIDLNRNINSITTIDVKDMSGRIVKTFKGIKFNTGVASINTQRLNNGIYIVCVFRDDFMATGKLVISK